MVGGLKIKKILRLLSIFVVIFIVSFSLVYALGDTRSNFLNMVPLREKREINTYELIKNFNTLYILDEYNSLQAPSGYLWVVDSHLGNNKLLKINPLDGSIEASFDIISSPSLIGLAFDGNNLWISDSNNNKIYKYSRAGLLLNTYDCPSPCRYPYGLTWDGNNLWVAAETSTYRDYKLFKLSSDLGSILTSIDIPVEYPWDPEGLTWDGSYLLYTEDSFNGYLRKVTPLGQIYSRIYSEYDIFGLAFDGQNPWVSLWGSSSQPAYIGKLGADYRLSFAKEYPGILPRDSAWESTSVCDCGSWSNQGCGQGGCAADKMYQTRTCNPSGCDTQSQCVSDASCNPQCSGTDTSCGTYPSCTNCNSNDGCNGDSYRNYYCVSNAAGCSYTSDNCNDCSCTCGGYNTAETTANGNCGDGKDNDCDGDTDGADSGCATCSGTDTSCGTYPNCLNCNSYDTCSGNYYYNYYCSGTSCTYSSDSCTDCSCTCGGYNTAETTANGNCGDGKDNDCDGDTDGADSGCQSCECSSEVCCDGCHYKPSGSQPTGYTDDSNGFCDGSNSPTGTNYVKTRDYYCDGVDAGLHYLDTIVDTCSTCEYCTNNDLTCNYYTSSTVCGSQDCDYLDTICRDYIDMNMYCSGSSSTCSAFCSSYTNAPAGTSCGASQECDGNGNCIQVSHCNNGVKDYDELGIDCGGSCSNHDCCENNYEDSNLGEDGVDCGGVCHYSCVVPVILVHGYLSTSASLSNFENWLRADGFAVYNVDYAQGSAFANGDITDYAKVLCKEIDRIRRVEKVNYVDIVAHSMGGLVARECLLHYETQKGVRKLIMLGTPNHGTNAFESSKYFTTYIVSIFDIGRGYLQDVALLNSILGVARNQMRVCSPFLNHLNFGGDVDKSKCEYPEKSTDILVNEVEYDNLAGVVGLSSLFHLKNNDMLVSVVSAYLDGAYRNNPAYGYDHFKLVKETETYQWVKSVLDEEVVGSLSKLSLNSDKMVALTEAGPSEEDYQELPEINGTIYPGQIKNHSISVDSAQEIMFSLVSFAENVSFYLIDPNGLKVDETYCISNNQCNYSFFSGIHGYDILGPVTGNWSLIIEAVNVNESGDDYAILTSLITDLHLSPTTQIVRYRLNEQMNITANLTKNGDAVLEAVLTAKIHRSDGVESLLDLYDDGIHNDNSANDGVYGNAYTDTDEYGAYDLDITAKGSYNGNLFSRAAQFTLWVEDYPDLLVKTISFSNSTPVEDENVVISTLIGNIGEKEAINATIEFYHSTKYEDEFIGEANVSLGIGEEGIASVNWTNITAGEYNVTVLVSPFNSFLESDYSNNRLGKNITIRSKYSFNIKVFSPINKIYYTNSIDLNWTLNQSVSWCGYSIDSKEDVSILRNDVFCWGSNSHGGSDPYNGGNAVQVDSGWGNNCVLKSNGNVQCWGYSKYGESDPYNGGDAIQVSAGYYHTCVLKSNGNVQCWGYNEDGRADPYNGGNAIQVSAGVSHTCILKSGGNVKCWGLNDQGQVISYNLGNAIQVSAGASHTCILKSGGNVKCWGLNDQGQSEPYNGGDAIQLSAGVWHNCVLKSNGNVHCWGDNYSGKSTDYNDGDATQISVNCCNTCAMIHSEGNLTLKDLQQGVHSLVVSCNATLGRIGKSKDIFFLVATKIYNLTLSENWNLISLPISLSDNSVNSVFSNIKSIFTYAPWLYYFNETNNNFNTIDETKAYWVNSLENQTLTIEGMEFEYPIFFNLTEGWNLIAYPSLNVSLINESLKDVEYGSILTYKDDNWHSGFGLENLTPWQGYWVKVPANVTWGFDGSVFKES